MVVNPGQEVVEGQQVTISCQSDAAPPPTLVLSRDGMGLYRSDPLTPSSMVSFSLSYALMEDSALYQCDAWNQFGSQQVSSSLWVKGESGLQKCDCDSSYLRSRPLSSSGMRGSNWLRPMVSNKGVKIGPTLATF